MIKVWAPQDPVLRALVRAHPELDLQSDIAPDHELRFDRGDWPRTVHLGTPNCAIQGLVELIDNNPLVCTDEAAVPDAASTLAIIALGPLVQAGLLNDQPALDLSFSTDETRLLPWLETIGFSGDLTLGESDLDLGTVRALNLFAPIATPDDWRMIDSLYEEAYGGSFYVRMHDGSEWDTQLVAGHPWALVGLRMTPGDETSLLTVRVMADRDGKCGAAQALHMLNVMAGFEECLGIPDRLPQG